MRAFILSFKAAFGWCAPRSTFDERCMKTIPRLFGSRQMGQGFSLPRLSSPSRASGAYKSRLAFTPLIDRRGATVTPSPLSNYPAPWLQSNTLLSKGVLRLRQLQPGCVSLGARLFAECCALEQVGILTEHPCRLACGAVISPYAFEGCARLERIRLPHTRALTDMVFPSLPPAGIPIGCFHSSGVQLVSLPSATTFIGHKAFAHCKQLIKVDLSRTQVDVLHLQIFAYCQYLEHVSLPSCLQEISAEAFEACSSLRTLTLPRHLRNIGHRAFARSGHRAKQVNSACTQFVLRGPIVGIYSHDTLMPLKCIASTQLAIASNPRRKVAICLPSPVEIS